MKIQILKRCEQGEHQTGIGQKSGVLPRNGALREKLRRICGKRTASGGLRGLDTGGILSVPPLRILAFCLALVVAIASFGDLLVYADGEFDINVPSFKAPKLDVSNPVVYTGTPYPQEIVDQVYYTDLDHIFGKREIVRLTALGVLNNYGERSFRPSEQATGFEALMMVSGLSGGHGAIIQNVQDQAGTTTPPERLSLMKNKAYFDSASAKGIVQPNEVLGLEKPITRERAALFLARAVGKQRSYPQTKVYTFTDWKEVEEYARPLIEGLVQEGIIKLGADGSFAPRELVTRADLAVWMNAAFDRNPGLIGAQIGYGLVVGKKEEVKKDGAEEVKEFTFTLKAPDASTVQFKTTRSSSQLVNDFIVYKSGLVSVSRYLEIGDEVEYIRFGDSVRFVGDIANGQVSSELVIPKDKYHYTHFGTVADIKKVDETVDDKKMIKEIYRIADVTGDVFDIVVYEDGVTGLRQDITTYKNGVIGGVRLLRKGDSIEYIVNERMEVGFIKVKNNEEKDVTGTLNKIEVSEDGGQTFVTIFGYDEEFSRFPLAPYGSMTINGRIAPLKDFVYGMTVKAHVVGGYVISLIGESYSGEPGYIPPFGKMRMGVVRSVGNESVMLRKSNGETEIITFTPETLFTRGGAPSSHKALKVGEKIKAYFDQITGTTVSKIEIEGPELPYDRIYKGVLANFIPHKGELYLLGPDGVGRPEYIVNGDWEQDENYSREIAIAPDCEIYVENQKLTPKELERLYKGYQVYVVTNELFGKQTASKISVKRGAEMLHSSTVSKVDTGAGEIELKTRENFGISNATIILKDGRVVPAESIKKNDTVLIASESPDGTYAKNAMFVTVTSIRDRLFEGVRIGAVESAGTSSLSLSNYTFLNNNRFEAVNPKRSGYFKLTTSTVIKDISDPDKIKVIKPAQFYHTKYGRSENEDKSKDRKGLKYKRYYAYTVVDPEKNTVLGITMRKGGLMPRNLFDYKLKKEEEIAKELEKTLKDVVLTRGVVTGRDNTWKRFEITEAHDLTTYATRWKATGTNIYIKHQDAIIVKNNKVIEEKDVKVGDYIYVLRIGNDSLVIYVE